MGLATDLTKASARNDLVIGYVSSSGYSQLVDRHEIGSSTAYLDTQQDYQLLTAKEENDTTIIQFQRRFITHDFNDTEIKYGETLKIIYAYGDTDNINHIGSIKRGSKCINLFTSPIGSHCGGNVFEISTNISKVQQGTPFQCKAFKVSDLIKGQQHFVEIEPIFEDKNRDKVHHIVLYACPDDFDQKALNKVYPCYSKTTPLSIKTCAGRSLFAVWAPSVKKQSFKYPKHVGYPVGGPTDTKYIVLETNFKSHTNSPVITGFRIHHDSPRQYSSDVITTGSRTAGSLVIPPGQSNWVSTAYCTRSCSKEIKHPLAINGNEIKLFGMLPFARIGATAVWAKLMKNGAEIRGLPRTDEGIGQQPIQLLKSEITWKAGDELITYCQYNTTTAKHAISGGPLTSEAVCLNFIWFYPRINFSSCISQDYRVFEKFSRKYAKPIYNTGFGVYFDKSKQPLPQQYTNWTGVVWNQPMVKDLQEIYADNCKDSIKQVCMKASSNSYTDYKTNKPKLVEDPPSPCKIGRASTARLTWPVFLMMLIACVVFVENAKQ